MSVEYRRLHDRAVHAVARVHAHFGHFDARRIRRTDHSAGAARRHDTPARCSAGCDDWTARRRLRRARSCTSAAIGRGVGTSEKRDESIEIRLAQFVEGRHRRPPADDDFPERLGSHARGDVHERWIISGAAQVGTVTCLALLLVQHAPLRNRRGASGSSASGCGRLGAQLVDRRHVDAQHVHDAPCSDRPPCSPSWRRPARQESTPCLSTQGGVKSPSLRAFAMRVFHVSRSSAVRM